MLPIAIEVYKPYYVSNETFVSETIDILVISRYICPIFDHIDLGNLFRLANEPTIHLSQSLL